jgi:hypothetical protein
MYVLRSKNRPGYEAYEPESISAWSVEPDVELAPMEAWEAVPELEAALQAAPAFALVPAPAAPAEAPPEEEPAP